MLKTRQVIAISLLCFFFSGCVTQNYENNAESPVIESDSTHNEIALTRISLGMGYLNMGNTTQAKLNLEKAKRFAPNLTQVYTAFAHYYDVVDEPEQAIAAFEHALSLNAHDADTLNNYGVFLCKQEKYAASEKYMLQAIAVPSYLLVSQSYENLALCQLKDNNFEKAEMYLAKSISHSPNSASALVQMLRLQYAMGNYEEAQVYLRRYEKSTRRFTPNALALAYKVYEKMHKRRIAKNYASMLVKMFPNAYESKQYILNGLQHIEADDLASQYMSVVATEQKKPKKRVMVLSPNKQSGIALASKTNVLNTKKTTVLNVINNEKNKVEVTKVEVAKVEVAKVTQPTVEKTQAILNKNTENKKVVKTKPIKAKASVDEKGNKIFTLPVHMVAKGDSLFSIAKRYDIKIYQIERWNGFKRSKILNIGDVIYLADPKKALKQ